MNEITTIDAWGELSEPTTLRIQRLLPAPVERVWAHLTDSDLRRRWLAAGEMTLEIGAPFEFVWRNDELTDPAGERPDGFSAEHRMQSHVIELDPPRLIAFAWDGSGGVTIELEPKGGQTLLTLTHRRVEDRGMLLGVSAGWHLHLDILEARVRGIEPAPLWDEWRRLRPEYERRFSA